MCQTTNQKIITLISNINSAKLYLLVVKAVWTNGLNLKKRCFSTSNLPGNGMRKNSKFPQREIWYGLKLGQLLAQRIMREYISINIRQNQINVVFKRRPFSCIQLLFPMVLILFSLKPSSKA
jgi:hypothetical protein